MIVKVEAAGTSLCGRELYLVVLEELSLWISQTFWDSLLQLRASGPVAEKMEWVVCWSFYKYPSIYLMVETHRTHRALEERTQLSSIHPLGPGPRTSSLFWGFASRASCSPVSGEVTCLAAAEGRKEGRKEGTGNNEALVKSQVFCCCLVLVFKFIFQSCHSSA